jgi:hypothetical protein
VKRQAEKKVTAFQKLVQLCDDISVFPGVLHQEAEIIPVKPDQGNACAGSFEKVGNLQLSVYSADCDYQL